MIKSVNHLICLLLIITNTSCQDNYVDKNLQDVEKKISKMLPMMIDSSTRVDSVKALPHSTIQYNNTIVDMTKEEINIPVFTKTMDSLWVQEMKTAQQFKVFYKNNVTLNYKYYDKNGQFITSIFITPEKYKK